MNNILHPANPISPFNPMNKGKSNIIIGDESISDIVILSIFIIVSILVIYWLAKR